MNLGHLRWKEVSVELQGSWPSSYIFQQIEV